MTVTTVTLENDNKPITDLVKRIYIFEPSDDIRVQLEKICMEAGCKTVTLSVDDVIDFISNPLDELKDMYTAIIGPTLEPLGMKITEALKRIKSCRPNPPIIVRVDKDERNIFSEKESAHLFPNVITYEQDDIETLKDAINKITYFDIPIELVNEINQLALDAISSFFLNVRLSYQAPHIVLDDVIRGSLIGMANLMCHFCQGSVFIDCSEDDVVSLIENNKTHLKPSSSRLDSTQSIISELTNLMLGKLRGRLFNDHDYAVENQIITLPVIINCQRNILQFSSITPQICFRYIIKDTENLFSPCVINLKLMFNIYFDKEKCIASMQKIAEQDKLSGESCSGIEFLD